MKARVTKAFPGVKDGETHPVTIEVGKIIDGALAKVAITQGWAQAIDAGELTLLPNAEPAPAALDVMTAKQLKAYAVEKNIDVGNATSKKALLAILAPAPTDQDGA